MQGRVQKEHGLNPFTQGHSGSSDSAAFETLFRDHYDLVFRTAFRITGNPTGAEDVLQTVFLRLIRRERAPDLSGGARGYLHQAAVHAALDILRRRTRHVPLDAAGWQSLPDTRPGPEASQEADGRRAWLRAAIAQLHPRSAEMFVLRFIEGCSLAEIARRLNTSQATVAVLLFRARRRLQKQYRSFSGGVS